MALKASDMAWVTLGVGVFGFDMFCEETMSQAAERYMRSHPWVVRSAAFMLAAHVCGMMPDRLDPLNWLFEGRQRVFGRRTC